MFQLQIRYAMGTQTIITWWLDVLFSIPSDVRMARHNLRAGSSNWRYRDITVGIKLASPGLKTKDNLCSYVSIIEALTYS